ncbi:L-threonylcarbamoyladenylate synthase [Roseburia hominis]
METIIRKIDRTNINKDFIEEAGTILKQGGLVAFPTETVYGLGANALNEEAAKKTYAAKGRPSDNPLIVHIARTSDLEEIVEEIPPQAFGLAEVFWPGPLTMIFRKSACVPYGTTGGLDTVAVRMPDDEIARELILAGGGYISAPSANTSGRPSPTAAQHVEEDLEGKIEMILDGGSVEIGVESTIVDMTVTPPMILRPGAVTKEMLEEIVGEVAVDITLLSEDSTQAPKAPGMKYRHYAPKAEMILVEGEPREAVKAIKQIAYEQVRMGEKVGIIATNESVGSYTAGVVKSIGSRENERTVARSLYRVLREFDEENVRYIYSEVFPEVGIGTAVMNRLGKAAGHKTIRAEAITCLQKYHRIVFVSNSDNCRAPIAAALMERQPLLQEFQITSRGMVVLFPEPLSPRAEELLASRQIVLEGYEAVAFSDDILNEDTLVLTMEQAQKQKILGEYPKFKEVYTLGEFTGSGDEVPQVYGQPQEEYDRMFMLIEENVRKLADQLNEEAKCKYRVYTE